MDSYALVDKQGQVVGKNSTVPILDVRPDLRLSFKSDIVYTKKNFGSVVRYKEGDCEGKAIAILLDLGGHSSYTLNVVGPNYDTVRRVINVLERKMGVVTEFSPGLSQLPELSGIRDRIAYLTNWILSGAQA